MYKANTFLVKNILKSLEVKKSNYFGRSKQNGYFQMGRKIVPPSLCVFSFPPVAQENHQKMGFN